MNSRALVVAISLTLVLTAAVPVAAASRHSVVPTRELVTYRTSGSGVSYPDSTDPTRFLSVAEQRTFQCVRRVESRNHAVDGSYELNAAGQWVGSEGWYQFTKAIWDFVRRYIFRLPATPNQATRDEQSEAAVFYLDRNGRFGVEWAAEATECPGRF